MYSRPSGSRLPSLLRPAATPAPAPPARSRRKGPELFIVSNEYLLWPLSFQESTLVLLGRDFRRSYGRRLPRHPLRLRDPAERGRSNLSFQTNIYSGPFLFTF